MRIDEIFCSIQGEGSRRGRPCTFVRLTGCPLRCRWCDTAYAFHGGEDLAIDEILRAIAGFGPRLVCVTGGEPLAQNDVHQLMARLLDTGHEVILETSGALDARAVDARVVRILDLKAPGSGEVARNHWPTFDELLPTDEVKIVISDRTDFEWARDAVLGRALPDRVACVLLSPAHGELEPAELARWILEENLQVVLQLQEHKLIWPGVERGV